MIGRLVVLAALAGVAITGCADSAHDAVGSVEVALTATSASGATYRLQTGTRLVLENPGYAGQFPLDGDAPSQFIDVPEGSYNVQLEDDFGDTTTWYLARTDRDGTLSYVPGTLDLAPTVDVTNGRTTALTLRFHVGTTEVVTFTRGTVAVTIAIDEGPASSLALGIGTGTLHVDSAQAFAATPPEVANFLPVVGTTGEGISVTAMTTGPWRVTQEHQVCADATVTAYPIGDTSYVVLVTEAQPTQDAWVCITQNSPTDATLSVALFRRGTATTPELSVAGDRTYTFDIGVYADMSLLLFDGTTLDLRPLQATQPALTIVSGRVFGRDENEQEVQWLQFVHTDDGGGTASLTPF